MILVIGTKSQRKIETVKKMVQRFIGKTSFDLIAFDVPSNVSETPWNKETYNGSRNRANSCHEKYHDADYAIGIESGLAERYGQIYEEAWCCIIDKNGQEFYGYSSGLKVPEYILRKMNEHKLPHYLIFAKLNNHFDKAINADTWSNYSGKMLVREVSLEESLRNALVQIFASDESYYKKTTVVSETSR